MPGYSYTLDKKTVQTLCHSHGERVGINGNIFFFLKEMVNFEFFRNFRN